MVYCVRSARTSRTRGFRRDILCATNYCQTRLTTTRDTSIMTWNTSNTLELLGVIGTSFGVGVTWYKRRRITAASRWVLG
jgi:hypothetical protein